MGRYIASIASGIIAGLITAITAGFFLQAATWSSIHGGMSGTILAVLFVGGMAAPPVCGFLAGRAIYRRPLREPIQMTASTGLNCPHCGCSLKPSANYSTSNAVYRRGMPHSRAVSLRPEHRPHARAAGNLKFDQTLRRATSSNACTVPPLHALLVARSHRRLRQGPSVRGEGNGRSAKVTSTG